jgi:uncharacterized protein DUF2341/type IX secretion system substrate protein
MKRFYFTKLVVLLTILLGWNANPVMAQCNCSWQYMTPVVIKNLGSVNLLNYQVSITVNTAALISAGKMIATGDDIRFSNKNSCANLPYWIESGINTATTVIWINVDNVPASGSDTINMYYGSPGATPGSNGDATFILFDDFLNPTLDPTKWVYSGSDGKTIAGGTISINGSSWGEVESVNSYPNQPQAGGYLSELNVVSATGAWPSLAQSNNNTYSQGACMFMNGGTMYFGQTGNVGGTGYEGYLDNSMTAGSIAGVWSYVRTPANTLCKWPGGSYTYTNTNSTTTSNQYMAFGPLDGGTATMVVDWFRARNYYPAGTTQTPGTETVNGAPPITGATSVCTGLTTLLSESGAGGVWSSGSTTIATVGTSGLVTGVSVGATHITYTLGACSPAVIAMSVKGSPAAIAGASSVCSTFSTLLSDATPGGVWSSNNTSVATITAGVLTGVGAGVATISYTNPIGGCAAFKTETVNLSPTIYTVSGGGTMCAGGTGFHIIQSGSDGAGVSYQMMVGGVAIGPAQLGSGSSLDFGIQTTNGTYTVVATNTTAGCQVNMAGSGSITVNPLPNQYPLTVTGGGTSGSFCAGGTGVDVILGNSDVGISYQLFIGALAVGTPKAGTGSSIDFGPQTAAGIYSIVGTNTITTCFGNMSNTVTISINPLPNIYSVTGGGSYCAFGTGVLVGLSGSDIGVTYQLLVSGSPVPGTVAGTGSAITFGAKTTPGTYTVVATNPSTTCTQNMAGSVVISINPLPSSYTVSGGGVYCPGGTGKDISLSFSSVGVSYQLFNGGVAVTGALLGGTGSALDFGMFTTPGTYTITGTNTTTTCFSPMSGSATINISTLPTPYIVSGGGAYCSGGSGKLIGLSLSDIGITYQLYVGGIPVPGGTLAGTGGSLNFGLQTAGGTYTIVGTNSVGCTNNMNGSVTITINPLPFAYTVGVTPSGGYCAGSAAPHVTLSGSDVGTSYQLYLGGVAVPGGVMTGTGSGLDFGARPAVGTYTVGAVNTVTGCAGNMSGSVLISINPLPIASSVTGGGAYCTGGTGEHIGLLFSSAGISYQLLRGGVPVGSPIMGVGGSLDFGLQTATGIYTVVGTNTVTSCSNNMTGSVTIATIPLPTQYTVTGGGPYCSGGAGPHIGLSASNVGINYQLYNGSSPVGGTVHGSGLVLDFGNQPVGGTYTVVATNATTGCTNNMLGSVIVNVTPLPNVYTVIGGGNYCAGTSGVHVGLNMSDIGIKYQLNRGGSVVGAPVMGTGSPLDFGLQTTPGTYKVVATDAIAGCTSNMSGSAVINISPLPTTYTVTGGGSFCGGGTGEHIYLSGSNVGVDYQLMMGGTSVGVAMHGTGTSLDFGLWVTPGSYTVVATNTTTGCTANMISGAVIIVNPAPTVYNVTGGGSYCAGGTGVAIGLSGSNLGVAYQLYNGVAPVGFVAPGSGSSINFGLHSAAGIYTVVATNPVTGCTANMALNAPVSITPWVTPNVTLSSLGYTCAGTLTSFTTTEVNGGLAPAYQWSVNGSMIAGATNSSFADTSMNLDVVKVTMTSNDPCPSPSSVSATETVNIHAVGAPTVFIAEAPGTSVCQGTAVTFTVSSPTITGSSPKYSWTRSSIPQDSGMTYTYVPTNNDVVTLTMTSNDPCASPATATSNVTMTVQGPAAAPVFTVVSSGGLTIGLGQSDTMKVVVTSGGSPTPGYQWVLNGTPLAGETNSTYVSSNFFDKDSIACIVTSAGTCGGTPAGRGVTLKVRNTTGIGAVGNGSDIRVLPNPNKGTFTIKGSLNSAVNEEVSLEIVNMIGQVVYRNKIVATNGTINEQVNLGNSMANGMYILSVRSESENNIFHFVIEQ